MSCIDRAYIQARIDKLKQRIEAVEDALLNLQATPVFQYTLDTGQTREVVTKLDVPRLEDTLDRMNARLQYWCNLLNGGGTFNAGPAF